MGTDTNNLISEKRAKLMRHRWLWSVVMLCLLLWGIKAIHRAMQPKYQGKTAAEWFDEVKVIHTYHDIRVVPQDPAALALTRLGTNAVWYIWRECDTKDSHLGIQMMDIWRYYILGMDTSFAQYRVERRDRAEILLRELGPATKCLVPELVSRVDHPNSEQARQAALWLGYLHQSPELSVPALTRALKQFRRMPADECSVYVAALGRFGAQAQTALPMLVNLHDNPTASTIGELELFNAIMAIDGTSLQPKYLAHMLVLDPKDMGKNFRFLMNIQENGLPPKAIAALMKSAQTQTNEQLASIIMRTVEIIDPKVIYRKP